jgi:PhnB protein
MTKLTSYIFFEGNCKEAMTFYKSCLGGKLTLVKVSDSPMKDQIPKEMQEKILNAHLKSGPIEFSGSDILRPDRTPIKGNTVCLFLYGGTYSELKPYFNKLSAGGKVIDPLTKMFLGTFGSLTDKYGVRWMFLGKKE